MTTDTPPEDDYYSPYRIDNVTVLRFNETAQPRFYDLMFKSVYIFDQCGRLTYIINFPWSQFNRPYVKASILSTIFDAPCGNCNVSS